jgi:hypothetical protein
MAVRLRLGSIARGTVLSCFVDIYMSLAFGSGSPLGENSRKTHTRGLQAAAAEYSLPAHERLDECDPRTFEREYATTQVRLLSRSELSSDRKRRGDENAVGTTTFPTDKCSKTVRVVG